ncbi:MAG: ribosome rescue protein RqcH [Halodesulfurarchaeum sp.]
MDPKRAVTSFDLVSLTGELGAYTGATVDKAYLYDGDLIRLKMRDYERGRIELLVQVGETKRAHVTRPDRVPDAPERPPNFAKMLRNRIAGADLSAVRQHGFDRILEFEFRRADADTTLVAELFGEGNVAVLDATGSVIDSLSTVRLRERTVAPGVQYGYPGGQADPRDLDFEAFVARMNDSDTDVVRTLATQLNLGGLYAEELCTRTGVEKATSIEDATEEEYRRLFDALSRLIDRLESGNIDPRVYYEDGTRVDVTPIPLEEYEGLESEQFDSFNAALDDYFTNREREDETPGSAEPDRPDFEGEIAERERIIAQQEAAIEDFEEAAAEERAKAETLYERYDLVDEILTTIREARAADHSWADIEDRLEEAAENGIAAAETVAGIDPSTGTVDLELDGATVTLDPSMGVEKNADRLYKQAKEIESKRKGAEEALEETRKELAAINERRESWEAGAGEDGDETRIEDESETDWLSRQSIPVRRTEPWHDRFRWFRTSDGFLVLGGRNADQNEELVSKYMEGGDKFFHTQAHGGPVTVLKSTEPSEPARDVDVPDRSLNEAARFAVTYSTVWKDGRGSGDVYMVRPDQVSKTPESGEYLEKGGFAIRGDRTYFRDTPVGCAIGITCEPETRVIGGPPEPIEERAATSVRIEPGRYAQGDAAKRIYRTFRERFADTSFVRKVASPDEIQKFMPPGGSRMID